MIVYKNLRCSIRKLANEIYIKAVMQTANFLSKWSRNGKLTVVVNDAETQEKQYECTSDDFIRDFSSWCLPSCHAINGEHNIDAHDEHKPWKHKISDGQTWKKIRSELKRLHWTTWYWHWLNKLQSRRIIFHLGEIIVDWLERIGQIDSNKLKFHHATKLYHPKQHE